MAPRVAVPAKRPRHEDEFVGPIVGGVRCALTAAARAGARRVVCISSIDTVIHNSATAYRVRTEEDWSDPAECGAYARAKLLAERVAWDLADEHNLELVTLLPGGVNGPLLCYDRASSADAPRWMLGGKMPVVPKVDIDVTDVRDLAAAHRLATETPAVAGNRHICASGPVRLGEIAAILAAEYGPARLPSLHPPLAHLGAAGTVPRERRYVAGQQPGRSEAGQQRQGAQELGWSQRPVRESHIDNAEDLIAHGIVTPRPSP